MQRNVLEKSISFNRYLAVGLGAIIGIGWVIYSGQWLIEGGPAGAALAFLICGILLLPIGICYAELTSATPVAGGELAFSYMAFGSFPAFLTAWAVSLSYIALTPFETIAIGALLEAMAPSIKTPPLYEVGGYGISVSNMLPGLIAGIALIFLNYRGAASSTRAQSIIISILIACSVIFIVTAFLNGNLGHLTPMFAAGSNAWATAPASIISVLVVAPYFMSGFDTIPQAAEEAGASVKPRQLGIAIISCILLGALFYVLIILAVAMSLPADQLADLLDRKDVMPTAEVFRVAFGFEWAANLVLFAGLLGLITTLNGFYIASTRLLFSMGRGGLLPHWFGKVHPKHHTPSNAIIFVGAISLAGPFIGQAALVPIVNSGSLCFALALAMTCLSAVRLRTTRADLTRPFRTHISVLVAGAVVAILFVTLMIVPSSPGFLTPLQFGIIGVWMILGAAFYLLRSVGHTSDRESQEYLILGEYAKSRTD